MLKAPLSDLVAAVEEEAEEEHMDKDDDLDPKDNLPLALRALQPAGGVPSMRPMRSVGVQTGGISSVGRVVATDRNSNLDAGTIVKRVKVSL